MQLGECCGECQCRDQLGHVPRHTVERDIEADGALRDPLADAVAGAFLDAGDQGGVVDDAVEDLALRRLGRAQGQVGLAGPRRAGASTHGLRARAGW